MKRVCQHRGRLGACGYTNQEIEKLRNRKTIFTKNWSKNFKTVRSGFKVQLVGQCVAHRFWAFAYIQHMPIHDNGGCTGGREVGTCSVR